MKKEKKEQVFALCVENKDCEDLEKRKIYKVLPDEEAEKEGYLRVIDESGEDYLYPRSYFVLVQLPREAQEALARDRSFSQRHGPHSFRTKPKAPSRKTGKGIG